MLRRLRGSPDGRPPRCHGRGGRLGRALRLGPPGAPLPRRPALRRPVDAADRRGPGHLAAAAGHPGDPGGAATAAGAGAAGRDPRRAVAAAGSPSASGWVGRSTTSTAASATPRTRSSWPQRLDEALPLLPAFWSGRAGVALTARTTRSSDVTLLPPTVQQPRVPIWIAGFWPNRPPMRRAARWDGVVPLFKEHRHGDVPPVGARRRPALVRRGAARLAGRVRRRLGRRHVAVVRGRRRRPARRGRARRGGTNGSCSGGRTSTASRPCSGGWRPARPRSRVRDGHQTSPSRQSQVSSPSRSRVAAPGRTKSHPSSSGVRTTPDGVSAESRPRHRCQPRLS